MNRTPPLVPHGLATGKAGQALLLLICLAAAWFRWNHLAAKSLWLDEITQVTLARLGVPYFFGQLTFYSGVPLDYLLQVAFLGLGLSEYALRFHAALLGILTVPLLYLTAYALTRHAPASLAAAALLTPFPLHIQYSQEARPYALFCLAELCAFYLAWRWLAEGRPRAWWGYTLATLAAFNTHYFALLFVLPVAFLVAWCAARSRGEPRLVRALLTRFVATLLLAFLSWAMMPWLRSAWMLSRQALGLAVAPDWPTSPLASLSAAIGSVQAQLLLTGKFGWIMGGLLLLGLARLAYVRPTAAAFSVAWLLLPTGVAAWFLMRRGFPVEPRYVLPILPIYLLLIAEGTTTLARIARRLLPRLRRAEPVLVSALVAFLLFFIGARTRAYYAWPKESWREAVGLLARYAQPVDAILVPHMEETLGLYAPALRHTLWEPKSLAEVQRVAQERGRLWLVWSPYHEMGEENAQAVLSWLYTAGAAEFTGKNGIRVFLWQAGRSASEMREIAARLQAPPPLNLTPR